MQRALRSKAAAAAALSVATKTVQNCRTTHHRGAPGLAICEGRRITAWRPAIHPPAALTAAKAAGTATATATAATAAATAIAADVAASASSASASADESVAADKDPAAQNSAPHARKWRVCAALLRP